MKETCSSNIDTFYNWNGSKQFNPKEQYEWRLKWLNETIIRRKENGENISDQQVERWYREESQAFENNKKDWNIIQKLRNDTCIIVPTHYYHAPWIRACLESCQKTGYFVILAYDNPIWDNNQKIELRYPNAKTLNLPDYISVKHKSWGSGVAIPHSWNMWYSLHAAKSFGFKYVFNLNGDCIMEKPEGVHKLRGMMEDYDAVSCEYIEGRYFGTMAYLSKIDPMITMWDMNLERMYQYNIGNAEGRLGRFSKELNMKIVEVENPEDHHFKPPGVKGSFREWIGLRHLHAEHKVRRWNKMDPVQMHYCEIEYLNAHEQKTLLKYWQTGDKKYLEAWWN